MRSTHRISLSLTLAALFGGLAACSSSGDGAGSGEGASTSSGDMLVRVLGDGEASVAERTLGDPDTYAALSAKAKRDLVWSKVTGDLRCGLTADTSQGSALEQALIDCQAGKNGQSLPAMTFLGSTKTAFFDLVQFLQGNGFFKPAFDVPNSDEMPANRRKIMHAFGGVASVELRIDNRDAQYTGIIRAPQGDETETHVLGVARIGPLLAESLAGFGPGMSLKLFTDKGVSVDVQASTGLAAQWRSDGSPDHNPFTQVYANEFPTEGAPTWLGLVTDFLGKVVHRPPNVIPIDHIGRRNADGTTPSAPRTPPRLLFKPQIDLSGLYDEHPDYDWRIGLAHATKDATPQNPVTLYEVAAADTLAGDNEVHLGTLVATSPFLPSRWADTQLYSRHNRGCTESDGFQRVSPSLCDESGPAPSSR